jgi:hypothetical protein
MDHEPASVPTPTADRACEGPCLEALGVRLMHLRKAVGLTRWELPAGEGWVSSWRRGRLERARTLQEPSVARQLVLQSIGNRLVGRSRASRTADSAGPGVERNRISCSCHR